MNEGPTGGRSEFIAKSDKKKWITCENLDEEYLLYYFYVDRSALSNPEKFYDRNNYLMLLLKPEYAVNIHPIPLGHAIPNVEVHGIPYIDKNKKMPNIMNYSVGNPFRVKSIYYDEDFGIV